MTGAQPAGIWINPDGRTRPARIKSGPLYEAFFDFRRTDDDQLNGTPGDLARAYCSAVWAYRCVKLRADAVAGVPLILTDRAGARIETHPVLDLLRDVNPFTMNLGDLLRATEAAYNIWGVAYWLKIPAARNGAGAHLNEPKVRVRPGGQTHRSAPTTSGRNENSGHGNGRGVKWLAWLNPQTVVPIADSQKGITGYKQTVGAHTRLFGPEEIIAFRNFNPLDDLGGLSPLAVALREVNAELQASRFVASFFANDARPAGLLTSEQNIPDGEAERVRAWWERLFKGAGNKWKTGVVGGGLRWQTITFPMTDLALADLRGEDRRAICAAFGVPAALAGAWEAATYATAREQKASFYEDTIIPQLEYMAEVLNWSLLPHYPDLTARGARLAFDVDSISVLRETAEDTARRLAMLFGAGLITQDEARAELGLKPLETLIPRQGGHAGSPLQPPDDSRSARERGRQAEAGKSARPSNGRKARSGDLPTVRKELSRWERFAVRRVKAGKSLRDFESAIIPPNLKRAIDAELATAETVEQVRETFGAVRKVFDSYLSPASADGGTPPQSDPESKESSNSLLEPSQAVLPLSDSERGPGGEVGEE